MPEYRKDPIVDRWVIMAPERASRPIDTSDRLGFETRLDPFAEGNESTTTPEVFACRSPGSMPDGPGWRVRVVPNKFPALLPDGIVSPNRDGIYESMNAIGVHEVIIECPHFETNLARLPVESIREILGVYQQRLLDLKSRRQLAHAVIFKNKGASAGASLEHCHSQLIATSAVPISISEELNGALEYYQRTGKSLFQEMIQQEISGGSRVVVESSRFVAFCPFASRFAFETWILPRSASSHFESIDSLDRDELGTVLKTVLRKLDVALDDPDYNYLIHSAPFHQPELPHYQWHFEIFPRLTRVAGFEWGSGIYINSVLPEDAATILRNTKAD